MKKIVIIFISILIILLFLIIRVVKVNENYEKEIYRNVNKYYTSLEKIENVNKYDIYYILTTKNSIIILDKKYQEIKKEKISNLYNLDKNYDIIYKNEIIMYLVKTKKNNKLIYSYYNALSGEKIDTMTIGG